MHIQGHDDILAMEDNETRRRNREKKMSEKHSFSSNPPSTAENVSAVNQQHCEETVASATGLY